MGGGSCPTVTVEGGLGQRLTTHWEWMRLHEAVSSFRAHQGQAANGACVPCLGHCGSTRSPMLALCQDLGATPAACLADLGTSRRLLWDFSETRPGVDPATLGAPRWEWWGCLATMVRRRPKCNFFSGWDGKSSLPSPWKAKPCRPSRTSSRQCGDGNFLIPQINGDQVRKQCSIRNKVYYLQWCTSRERGRFHHNIETSNQKTYCGIFLC